MKAKVFTEITELCKWEVYGREKRKKKKDCKSCHKIFGTFTDCRVIIAKTEELKWEEPWCHLITS